MDGICNYEIGTGRAFDEDGAEVELRFCVTDVTQENVPDCVYVNGEIHACRDFSLFANLLSFWVQPAPEWEPVIAMVEHATPTLSYQTVCDVFNRLARLESEGHHGGQTFYIVETVWGLLTSMGVVVDLWHIESALCSYGSLLDGLFRELNAKELAFVLEGCATQLGGER